MVEMGICLPVVLLVVFSAIELADGVFLKQSLAIGAYEAARVATRPGGIRSDGIQRGQEVLAARGVTQFQLTISPDVQANTARGTPIAVTAEAPLGGFSVGPMRLFSGLQLRHTVHMVRQ
jgi:Flp pilus assembly protein TadG